MKTEISRIYHTNAVRAGGLVHSVGLHSNRLQGGRSKRRRGEQASEQGSGGGGGITFSLLPLSLISTACSSVLSNFLPNPLLLFSAPSPPFGLSLLLLTYYVVLQLQIL